MSSIAFVYNTSVFGPISRSVSSAIHSVVDATINYTTRARAERQLASLDDRLLEDIGLSRFEIHDKVWGGKAH